MARAQDADLITSVSDIFTFNIKLIYAFTPGYFQAQIEQKFTQTGGHDYSVAAEPPVPLK